MELIEAMALVLELADQSILTDEDAGGNDALEHEQARQNQAVEIVATWAKENLGLKY